jgi:CRP/FNR family transcriptional regulator, cyclic AMP receptor protein
MIMEGAQKITAVESRQEPPSPCRASAGFDFSHLLPELTSQHLLRKYDRGELVFSQGAAADAVFCILCGEIKLTAVSPQGKEAVIAILPKGSFFGIDCVAGRRLRTATATAVQPCKVLRLPKAQMLSLVHNQPEFAEIFIDYLLLRYLRLEEDLLDQLFNSSEKRLARLLLLLAHFGEESEPLPAVKISHETLAEMIGTTRSRVTFFLNRFRRQGFIQYDNGLRVYPSLLKVVLRD